jgi:23S rRNA (adenine2030-N6)-methyltransferase
MNYRHAFHAGNFADVLKHVVLALCLQHLRLKDTAFRVLDTHAGRGLYDLDDGLADKTGEWRHGIGRILSADAEPPPPEVQELLAPWLDAVVAANGGGAAWDKYPGSPWIAAQALRTLDRLVATELHPSDRNALSTALRHDRNVKVVELDGWLALRSFLPFPERRGLVLIDPPYEDRDELVRLPKRLAPALDRFATGTYVIWYPIKAPEPVDALYAAIAGLGVTKHLRADLLIQAPIDTQRLNGCGLLIINPPWRLAEQLSVLLPFLTERLAQADGATWRLEVA